MNALTDRLESPSPTPRLSFVSRRARTIALGLLLPLLALGGCRSKAVEPRPGTWAQPVPSVTLKNWYQVDADVYRSEQPTRRGFEEIRAKGIKTIINLRNDHSDAALVEGLGLELVEIPTTAWGFSEDDLVKVLKAVQAAPKPVLIHCERGADRTGVVIAMYRVVIQGWTKKEAVAELKHGGFGFHAYFLNIPAFIYGADVTRIKARLRIP
jgi:tyrosine-protein phosphatase SIW14